MMPHIQDDLDLLAAQLRQVQADYEWARSRRDIERLAQLRLRINRLTAERDLVSDRLGARADRL
jgi:hypothetical protein